MEKKVHFVLCSVCQCASRHDIRVQNSITASEKPTTNTTRSCFALQFICLSVLFRVLSIFHRKFFFCFHFINFVVFLFFSLSRFWPFSTVGGIYIFHDLLFLGEFVESDREEWMEEKSLKSATLCFSFIVKTFSSGCFAEAVFFSSPLKRKGCPLRGSQKLRL